MNELVTIKGNKATVSSLDVANHFERTHRNVIQSIENTMKNSCDEEFNRVNFHLSSYKDETGRKLKCYEMTRDGFALAVMGFTGKKAMQWKIKYIEAFNRMEQLLTEKQTQEWIETRKRGKLVRRAETDVIKQLVEYARDQGSAHADMLYMTYSKLANKYAGITKRDDATVAQLNQLSIYENIAENLIKEGMKKGMNYKEIYQATKERFAMVQGLAFLEIAM